MRYSAAIALSMVLGCEFKRGGTPQYTAINMEVLKGGVVSFGRNPGRYLGPYHWDWREEQTDSGVPDLHVRCSGRLVVVNLVHEDYVFSCADTEKNYGE